MSETANKVLDAAEAQVFVALGDSVDYTGRRDL